MVASACCATPSSPRADPGDKHEGHPAAPPGRPVDARICRGQIGHQIPTTQFLIFRRRQPTPLSRGPLRRTALIELGRNSPGDEDVTAALLKPSGPGKVRPKVQFAVDSPLEGSGYEPSVPRKRIRFQVRSSNGSAKTKLCDTRNHPGP